MLRVLAGMPFGSALGGAERNLRLVCELAPRHGLEMHVALLEHGPLEQELRALGAGVTVVETGRFREVGHAVRGVRRLAALVREQQPDVVLGWITRAQVYLGPAARLAGVPASRIAWFQHHVPTGDFVQRAATLTPARLIICASSAAADAQARLRPHRRTVVAPYGIADPAVATAERLAALREALGLPAGAAVIGIPGRLQRWKNQDRFVRAVGLARAAGHDVHGLVVGGAGHGIDLDFEPEVRRLTADLGLEAHVTFTGQVAEPEPYIQLMDVLVNASDAEPFGLTLCEAQALGVPALAADNAGPREIIEHGVSGWLVPDASPEALATGMQRLLDDDDLRLRLIAGGRERYERSWTADAGVERLAQALRRLT